MKKNLLEYSLNIATTITELFSKNKSYKNVRCYLPEQGSNITKDFKKELLNLHNISKDKPLLVVVKTTHKSMKFNAMNPEIRLEYIPKIDRTYFSTAYIIEEFNNIIDNSNIELFTAEDLAENFYKRIINTQDYYEQQLIKS